MKSRTLERIGFWVVLLCITRVIAVLMMTQREWILRIARILTDWAVAPQVVLWTFLVIAVVLLVCWERLAPSRVRKSRGDRTS